MTLIRLNKSRRQLCIGSNINLLSIDSSNETSTERPSLFKILLTAPNTWQSFQQLQNEADDRLAISSITEYQQQSNLEVGTAFTNNQ